MLFTSAWSSSPRPESPTGFSRFLEAREGPNPTFFKKAQPEVRPSPNFYDFGKPEARPSPNIRPVGYPTGLNHQKLHPIPPKKSNLII